MMIIFKLLITSVLALAASPPLPDGYKYGEKIEVSTISQEEAVKLFAEFKASKTIPWEYPVNGCHPRATEMTRIAEKKKVEMGKVVATGLFYHKTGTELYGDITWYNHIAPVVYVKEGETTVLKVFDPALFDEPVTEETWKKKLAKSGENSVVTNMYYGTRFQSDLMGWEKRKDRWHREDLIKDEAEFRKIREILAATKAKESSSVPSNESAPSGGTQ